MNRRDQQRWTPNLVDRGPPTLGELAGGEWSGRALPNPTYSHSMTPDSVVRELAPSDGFDMRIRSPGLWKALADAVNVGIDSHLEDFTRSSFDADTGEIWVHPEELHILVRRLAELEEDRQDEEAGDLRGGILAAIGVEEARDARSPVGGPRGRALG